MFWEMLASFVKASGELTESNAASAAANYNARIDTYNQTVTLQEGQIAENNVRRQAMETIGQSRANAGASGFSSNSGSPVDVFQSSVYNAEMDALNTRFSYGAKAKSYEMDAKLQRQRAGFAQQGGWLTASGTLLSGYGKGYQDSYLDSGRGTVPFRLG